jgi:hypothetical protein
MSQAVPTAWGFIGRDCKIPAKFDPVNASEAAVDAIVLYPCDIQSKVAFVEPMRSIRFTDQKIRYDDDDGDGLRVRSSADITE